MEDCRLRTPLASTSSRLEFLLRSINLGFELLEGGFEALEGFFDDLTGAGKVQPDES